MEQANSSPVTTLASPTRAATIDRNKLGMLIFILSEAVFFGSLLISYVYYRGTVADVAAAAKTLDIGTTAIFTVSLFSSSFTIWRADKAIRQASHRRFLFWLGATIVLGLVFLIGQGFEYIRLLNENITVNANLFGSSFYTITGFHGFHVFVGLVMLSILWGLSARGFIRGPHSSAAETISLYWHFVDVVWAFVFSIIYIWTLLS